MKKHIVFDHPIIFATVIMTLVYIGMQFVSVGIHFLLQWIPLDDTTLANITWIITYLTTGAVVLWIMKKRLNPSYHFFRNKDRFLESLKLLWPMILIILLNLFSGLVNGDPLANHGLALFTAIITNLCVGFIEEVIYRGAVVSNTMRVWKDKDYRVIGSVILAALPFGLMHLFNYTNGVMITLLQVCYAIGFGMIFASVYLRTGNLFSCVLIHGLVDVCGDLFESNGGVSTESIIVLLAISVFSIVYALFLLKKKDVIEREFESI